MMEKLVLFISWSGERTVTNSIGNITGARNIYIGEKKDTMVKSILSYPNKIYKTYKSFYGYKPFAVIVTNTFVLLPLTAYIFGKIFNIRIIFQTHTSGIVNSEVAYPSAIKKLLSKKVYLNMVSNSNHQRTVQSWGGKTIIVPDPPIEPDDIEIEPFSLKGKLKICYIFTYSNDEPYEPVINAMKDFTDITFYITGKSKGGKISQEENIIHTGYLSYPNYYYLLQSVDAIMVLTTRENTFLGGANEALSFKKPLVTSQTAFLKSYYPKGAIFIKHEEVSIRQGLHQLISNLNMFEREMSELNNDKKNGFLNLKRKLDLLIYE
jgi:hypothetical protein